jgi:hypothetical protein
VSWYKIYEKLQKIILYLLVTGVKRLLMHRDPSSIILRCTLLLILNRTLEELFTLSLSSASHFHTDIEYDYQIKHVFDCSRRHGCSGVVLDEHEAIISRGVEELHCSVRI